MLPTIVEITQALDGAGASLPSAQAGDYVLVFGMAGTSSAVVSGAVISDNGGSLMDEESFLNTPGVSHAAFCYSYGPVIDTAQQDMSVIMDLGTADVIAVLLRNLAADPLPVAAVIEQENDADDDTVSVGGATADDLVFGFASADSALITDFTSAGGQTRRQSILDGTGSLCGVLDSKSANGDFSWSPNGEATVIMTAIIVRGMAGGGDDAIMSLDARRRRLPK